MFHFYRALFPVLALKLSGLSPTEKYGLAVNFTNVDSARYRFSRTNKKWSQWSATMPDTTANTGRRFYEHPCSPALGAFWTTGDVTFDKLRLTNDLNKTEKYMVSMCWKIYYLKNIPQTWLAGPVYRFVCFRTTWKDISNMVAQCR
jgi:hypothetical protein